MKIFVIFFSETVRPTKSKLGTHVDNGWMYHIYQNQGLHCLPMSKKWDARLIWVKTTIHQCLNTIK